MGGPLDDAQRRLGAIQSALGPAPGQTAPLHTANRLDAPAPRGPVSAAPPTPAARLHEWPWTAAAGLVAASGVVHLVLTPEHMAEAQGQGLFFIVLGVVQIVLGLALIRHHARPPVRAAFVVTAASIATYVLTRFLPQPFTDGSEAIDTTGVATKLVELAGLVALGVALARLPPANPSARRSPLAAIAVLAVVGLALAGALYGIGLALEAAVPALSDGSTHGHDDGHGDHAAAQAGPARALGPTGAPAALARASLAGAGAHAA